MDHSTSVWSMQEAFQNRPLKWVAVISRTVHARSVLIAVHSLPVHLAMPHTADALPCTPWWSPQERHGPPRVRVSGCTHQSTAAARQFAQRAHCHDVVHRVVEPPMHPFNNLAGPSRRHASLLQASLLAPDEAPAYFNIRLSAFSGPLAANKTSSVAVCRCCRCRCRYTRVCRFSSCTFIAVVIDGSCSLAF